MMENGGKPAQGAPSHQHTPHRAAALDGFAVSTPWRAVLLVLASQVCFNLYDAAGKYLVRDFPVITVAWARFFFHFLVMAGYVALLRGRVPLRTGHPGLQVARGLLLVGFSALLIATLKHLPQAEAAAIVFVAPLAILALAGPLLGEHVTWARWVAVIAGLAGMLIVVRPGSGLSAVGVAFGVATLACNVAFQLITRKMALKEHPLTTVFLSAAIGTGVMALALPFGAPDHWPSPLQAALFLSFGLTGSAAHLLLIRAYRLVPASFVAPLIYNHIVLATLAGWAFFGDFPDAWSLAGMAVIVASGAGIALYERTRPRR
jgi:drug/metabolite transporter (DMT)-like permease